MKRAILTLIVLSWALLSGAQEYRFVRANVPFDFQVSGRTMQAGRYDFCWSRNMVVMIRPATAVSQKVNETYYVSTNSIEESGSDARASVSFWQIGNRYFLAGIHQPNAGAVQIAPSPEQKKYEKLARTKVDVQAEVGK